MEPCFGEFFTLIRFLIGRNEFTDSVRIKLSWPLYIEIERRGALIRQCVFTRWSRVTRGHTAGKAYTCESRQYCTAGMRDHYQEALGNW